SQPRGPAGNGCSQTGARWYLVGQATKGFNFKHPDLNNAELFNRILWKGIMGDDKPYPGAGVQQASGEPRQLPGRQSATSPIRTEGYIVTKLSVLTRTVLRGWHPDASPFLLRVLETGAKSKHLRWVIGQTSVSGRTFVLPNEDFPFNTVVCGTDCLGGRDLLQTLIATMALLFCLGTSALAAAQSLSGQPETAAAPGAEQRAGASQDAGLYLELQLARPVKVSKLKTGDILEGRLSRGVYKGDLEVFPAGSPVRLTVGKLERRKRESTDHWPGVIELLSPRHENYPTFESASILTSGGTKVPCGFP